jgi:hypothetical protein
MSWYSLVLISLGIAGVGEAVSRCQARALTETLFDKIVIAPQPHKIVDGRHPHKIVDGRRHYTIRAIP